MTEAEEKPFSDEDEDTWRLLVLQKVLKNQI